MLAQAARRNEINFVIAHLERGHEAFRQRIRNDQNPRRTGHRNRRLDPRIQRDSRRRNRNFRTHQICALLLEPIRQLELVHPRLERNRFAANGGVVAVELQHRGDRSLRFTFDVDSECKALIGADRVGRIEIGDRDSLGGRRRRRAGEDSHAVLEHRRNFRHRGVLGFISVAQQYDSLVGFRRKQTLGRGQRAGDVGGSSIDTVAEVAQQSRIGQRRKQPRVAAETDNPKLVARRHRGLQLFDLVAHPLLLIGRHRARLIHHRDHANALRCDTPGNAQAREHQRPDRRRIAREASQTQHPPSAVQSASREFPASPLSARARAASSR